MKHPEGTSPTNLAVELVEYEGREYIALYQDGKPTFLIDHKTALALAKDLTSVATFAATRAPS